MPSSGKEQTFLCEIKMNSSKVFDVIKTLLHFAQIHVLQLVLQTSNWKIFWCYNVY